MIHPHSCNAKYFYPRSPCGERRANVNIDIIITSYFYPRSPCGERPTNHDQATNTQLISIHALLAESDPGKIWSTALA